MVGSDRFSNALDERTKRATVRTQAHRRTQTGTAPNDLEAQRLPGQGKRGPMSVGFVGDGLNDCPALMCAHVGVALEGGGSHAAVEAAPVVLQGSIGHLPAAITLARRAVMLVQVNIFLALGVHLGIIVATVTVGVPLWLAVFSDNGVLLLVLANSLWPFCWSVHSVTAA